METICQFWTKCKSFPLTGQLLTPFVEPKKEKTYKYKLSSKKKSQAGMINAKGKIQGIEFEDHEVASVSQ